MKSLLPFIISGIATGAIFALAATGLVLTYKTSGIFNFGHGAIATASAYVFYFLHVDKKLHWVPSIIGAVFISGPLAGLVLERMARRMSNQRTSWKIVGTIGLILFVQGLATIKYGTDARIVDQFFPKSQDLFRFGGVVFQWAQVIVTVISVVAVGLLYLLFKGSRLGVQMQAVVDDPDLLDLQGTNPVRVRRLAWMIGSTLAGLSGVLLVPFIGLESITLTFLVVQAFGAATLGAFSSIPLTYLGALVIGVGSAILTKYQIKYPTLNGFSGALPFVVLFIGLLAIPKRKLIAGTASEARPAPVWRGPWQLRVLMSFVVFGFLAVVPNIVGTKLIYWNVGLVFMIVLTALGLLVRTAGLVSLCSGTFAGIGAVVFSQLAREHHWPYAFAFVVGAFVAAVAGALVAIPTIRLSGLFLALGTFGFGFLVERTMYSRGFMFTTLATGREMPRPPFARSDASYYRFVLVIAIAVIGAVVLIHRGRLGRLLKGLGDAPTAIGTLGLNTNMTRVIVFCISAFFTGCAGILYGGLVNSAESGAAFYLSFTSLVLIAVLALAPFRDPWFAIFGGMSQVIPGYVHSDVTFFQFILVILIVALFAGLLRKMFIRLLQPLAGNASSTTGPNKVVSNLSMVLSILGSIAIFYFGTALLRNNIHGSHPEHWFNVLFGFAAIRLAMAGGHHPMPESMRRFIGKVGPPERARKLVDATVATARARIATGPGLSVTNLTVRFGGLVAVNDVSLNAPTGRITGLIGPNGAGKTTTFNSCSGLNKPTFGAISLHEKDISKSQPGTRARQGLGRSFQIMQLAESLSVRENVALGREASQAGSRLLGQFFANGSDRREGKAATDEAMRLCGIEAFADLQAGALSTGQRRLVELARCLAGPFDVLLLDEPSSGLDHSETEAFGALLQKVVKERGCGILLVEHDMSLVMEICSYIYVLDFGQVIFEGDPPAITASPIVRQAYLGAESVETTNIDKEGALV
jgi:ABC-type branched-subunit amino acid transport system ATPase component/branched-subunit amino acid ABC-type transport system permease component